MADIVCNKYLMPTKNIHIKSQAAVAAALTSSSGPRLAVFIAIFGISIKFFYDNIKTLS